MSDAWSNEQYVRAALRRLNPTAHTNDFSWEAFDRILRERDEAIEAAKILWAHYLLVLPPEKHSRVRELMERVEQSVVVAELEREHVTDGTRCWCDPIVETVEAQVAK